MENPATLNPFEFQNFEQYLNEEMARRCKINASYSLRAFAQFLQIPASSLSHLLRGNRHFSTKMIQRLANKLGLSPNEIQYFIKGHGLTNDNYLQISQDQFQVISDWFHNALLELTKVKDFRPNIKWIAKALNISIPETKSTTERLVRLKHLKIENDIWTDISGRFVTSIQSNLTSSAAKKNQKKLLEKAIEAIDEIPLEKRDHTGMTMAIDENDLEQIKEKIKLFRRELDKEYGQKKNPTQVYQFNMALFPLSKIKQI